MKYFFKFVFIDCKNSRMSSQGSVGGVGSQKFKIDRGSPLWKYTTRIEQCVGGGGYIWKCNFCQNQYRSSYYRVKHHLIGPAGQGITMCEGPPEGGKKGLPAPQIASMSKEQQEADRLMSKTKKDKSKQKPPTPPSQTTSKPHPFLPTPSMEEDEIETLPSRKRGPIDTAFDNDKREIADIKVGRCLITNGVPFNLVRSPYWREMVKAINEAPLGYRAPGYEKLRTTILHKERKNVENLLKPIRDSWVQTGVSIVSDGWKDCKNRPLINVIVVCPKGAMFLKAVDCEGQVKDANFIAQLLIESIEFVGVDNVVQVITDNAKVCKAAGALVEARYEHIFWTPCTVHSLNLVMKTMGNQIEWMKNVYEGEKIQMFVTNHHMSQAIFRTFSRLELLKVNFKLYLASFII